MIMNGDDTPVRHDRAHGQAAGVHQDLAAPTLTAHARERWPQLVDVLVRYRGAFAYIDGQLPDGTTLPLCRLRYGGSAHTWGFAIYRASHDDYEPSILHNGYPTGSPQEALDCACGLYVGGVAAIS